MKKVESLFEKQQPLAIDFFSGSGSVTAAMKKAGYKVVAALDIDPGAAKTYKANHTDVEKFYQIDIRELNPNLMFNDISNRNIDLMAICAPCQPFSSQNRKRNNEDERISLLLKTIPFIKHIQPQTIWIENVPGFGNTEIFNKLKSLLGLLGYSFHDPIRVDAANFGVPQRRVRFVFLASKKPGLSHKISKILEKPLPRFTVREAFLNLRILNSGEKDPKDPLHITRRHHDITLKRLKCIPQNGGGRNALPPDLQLLCHQHLDKNSFPDVYGRMKWDEPAPTLTTGCTDLTRGRFAHPEQDRAITLREAARLQTFPDDYIFWGNHTQIATQIGNAVPMKMAYEMFRHIID